MRTMLAAAITAFFSMNTRVITQINPIPPSGRIGDDTIAFVYDPVGQWWLEHPVNEAAPLDMFDLDFNLDREEPGLDGETVSQMLSVDGSWQSGGQLDMVDLRMIQFGDVNKDGLLDALDIDALTDAVFYDGPAFPLDFDLNDDGINDSANR